MRAARQQRCHGLTQPVKAALGLAAEVKASTEVSTALPDSDVRDRQLP